jgi:hypothetical protein
VPDRERDVPLQSHPKCRTPQTSLALFAEPDAYTAQAERAIFSQNRAVPELLFSLLDRLSPVWFH